MLPCALNKDSEVEARLQSNARENWTMTGRLGRTATVVAEVLVKLVAVL